MRLARARALLGVRFAAHGRGADGLDCVGLAAAAFGVAAPVGFGLRRSDAARVMGMIDAAGLRRVGMAGPGDLLLCASAPGQLHLAVASDDGIIHADALLGRVVERPGAVPWPVIGTWGGG